jgi:hypothetical protein
MATAKPLLRKIPTANSRHNILSARAGLLLDLRIQLAAEQNRDYREPDPGHEADDCPERAIGFVVTAEVRDIPREQDRSCKP